MRRKEEGRVRDKGRGEKGRRMKTSEGQTERGHVLRGRGLRAWPPHSPGAADSSPWCCRAQSTQRQGPGTSCR